jgi:hypothetical protein
LGRVVDDIEHLLRGCRTTPPRAELIEDLLDPVLG